MISEQTITEAVQRLVAAAKPRKIILFGSYARGQAGEHSDLDLLVVEEGVDSRRREMVRLHDLLRPMRVPVDIVVVSAQAFREWQDVPGTVMHQAKTEGRVCYEAE